MEDLSYKFVTPSFTTEVSLHSILNIPCTSILQWKVSKQNNKINKYSLTEISKVNLSTKEILEESFKIQGKKNCK